MAMNDDLNIKDEKTNNMMFAGIGLLCCMILVIYCCCSIYNVFSNSLLWIYYTDPFGTKTPTPTPTPEDADKS